jgi:hypothetical protein
MNVSDKIYSENKNMFYVQIFFVRKWCCLWDNVTKYGIIRQVTHDYIIQRMHIACCVTNTTHTYSEFVAVFPFPQHQCLNKRVSVLLLYYSACLVIFKHGLFQHGHLCKFISCLTQHVGLLTETFHGGSEARFKSLSLKQINTSWGECTGQFYGVMRK